MRGATPSWRNPARALSCSRRFGCCSTGAGEHAGAPREWFALSSGLPKQVVGACQPAERGWRLALRMGRCVEIRKLTAPLALEGPEPAIRRPCEWAAADRTVNDAMRRGCQIVHGNPPGTDTPYDRLARRRCLVLNTPRIQGTRSDRRGLSPRLLGGHAVQGDNLARQRRFAGFDVALAPRRSCVRRGEAPVDSNRFHAIA